MKYIYLISFIFLLSNSFAQKDDFEKKDSIKIYNVEIDFLYNYYQQDGENAAVTGGIGDQHLTNHAPTMKVHVPLDSTSSVSVNAGIDYYSSASTDNIDYVVSSASSSDTRSHISIQYQKSPKKKKYTYGYGLGGSVEYDVVSGNLQGFFEQLSKDENRSLSFKLRYFHDSWKMIYPIELRNSELPSTDARQSVSFSCSFSQVLSKRIQVLATADIALQNGLLSTPFHRVYFEDQYLANLENLPTMRLRFPMSARLHYYITDWLIFKGVYNYYYDNFEINAQAFSIEFPIKITDYFRIYPFYRHYTQNSTPYFVGYKEVKKGSQEYYTADSDLQAFSSQKYGVGIAYHPLYGLARGQFKNPLYRVPNIQVKNVIMLKSIALRYAFYQKNIPFTAHSITFECNFLF